MLDTLDPLLILVGATLFALVWSTMIVMWHLRGTRPPDDAAEHKLQRLNRCWRMFLKAVLGLRLYATIRTAGELYFAFASFKRQHLLGWIDLRLVQAMSLMTVLLLSPSMWDLLTRVFEWWTGLPPRGT